MKAELLQWESRFLGASSSSESKASDSKSRGPGFETQAGHLVVGADPTYQALSDRCCGNHIAHTKVTPNFHEWDEYGEQKKENMIELDTV